MFSHHEIPQITLNYDDYYLSTFRNKSAGQFIKAQEELLSTGRSQPMC